MHAIAFGVLVLLFVVATVRPVNMGLLALACALLVAIWTGGASAKDVLAGFPGDLFVTLVGITFLFAVAERNGAVEWLVHGLERLTGSRTIALPWVMFATAATLTAIGALGPAAVAILAPIALRFASRHRLGALLMGLMVIHGAQAGAFTPSSVYGGIANGVIARAGLPPAPVALFLASFLFNMGVAALVFTVLGGLRLARVAGASETSASVDTDPFAGMTTERALTLVVLLGVAAAALFFRANIGVAAITGAALLALFAPKSQLGAEKRVAWPTVLLICGVVTYVELMQRLGTIDAVGAAIAAIGIPLLAALALCYLAGIASAFASSTALLGIVVPLAVPVLAGSQVGLLGTILAIAVATTIVDTSPFSTNGALVVASAEESGRDRLFRQLLIYSALITLLGPLLAWAVFVLPASS